VIGAALADSTGIIIPRFKNIQLKYKIMKFE
jgi:hypothetical protein